MKMPNGSSAVVAIEKLTSYSLNLRHRDGSHKARVFQAVLGLTAEHAEALRQRLLDAAATEEATFRGSGPFGDQYEIKFSMQGPNGNTAIVTSGWQIDTGGFTRDWPAFISSFDWSLARKKL